MSRAAPAWQERALRFHVAPVEYAHPSWWPEAFVAAFGHAVEPGGHAGPQLSAWMLRAYALGSAIDLRMEAAATRFWLLPADLVRRTATDIGAALHRHAIRRCISRASRQALQSRFDEDTLAYALSGAAEPIAPTLRRVPRAEQVPGLAECAHVGACALLRALDPPDGPVARRARLMFPRSWKFKTSTGMKPERSAALMAAAVGRALQKQPSWHWLFC